MLIKHLLTRISFKKAINVRTFFSVVFLLITIGAITYAFTTVRKEKSTQNILAQQLETTRQELIALKNQDQIKRNDQLQEEIENIQKTYDEALVTYEKLQDLRAQRINITEMEEDLAEVLFLLSKREYASASAQLVDINSEITRLSTPIVATTQVTNQNITTSNTPPGSGYSRQRVTTEIGEYTVDIISADLNSTRVIIDTASDGTCPNDCPVLPLADYVARSGAFAGVNGSYFCPASYPSCAGKTNLFDTLLMNKNKVYFNSENNVYSTVPVAVFGSGWARFIGRSLDWGRDTSVDGVIANQPLLVSGGNVAFGGDGDPKKGTRAGRSFIGATGSTVYIGVVHNATVAEAAIVLKTMGISDALNLDSGGSTALWSSGYKVGPGRNIPNAVLFVRR